MSTWKDRLRHAFAIDPGPQEPTADEEALLNRLAHEIVRRELTAPALAFLEMSRPLNGIGAQAMHFLMPMVTAVTSSASPHRLAALLERRQSVDWLCTAIERRQAEVDAARKSPHEGSALKRGGGSLFDESGSSR